MWEPIITFILLIIGISVFLADYESSPNYIKYVGIILICHFVFFSFTFYTMVKDINNMILFHVLKPVQYVLTSMFFYEVIEIRRIRKVILFSAPIFILVSEYLSFVVQGIEAYNSYSITLFNLLIVIWTLVFLRSLLVNTKVPNIVNYPAFWVSIGFLFYSVGTTFSEGLMNYLIEKHRAYALSFYYVGIILSFFMYGLIIIGFLSKKIFKSADIDS